ncbi:MAG: serpin family protein [Dehalococcoidia bacterium]|nr:serpin family protein [Dehalococcoidia bacterium]
MKKTLFLILAVTMVLGLTACTQQVSAEVIKSDKPRVLSPAISQTDMASLVDGNSAFALNLYQALKDTDGNLFYSPYSISEALAMTYGGARGDTEKQMAGALHFSLTQNQLHPAFNSLDQELAKRGQGAKGKDEKGFRLHVVNAIWGQNDFKFTSEYLDLLAQNYGAGLRILDFIKATEQSRTTINQWVSDQTESKIKDLIPRGAIDPMTRLVLTNAIYFNAAWKYPFTVESTSSDKFHLLNGSEISVPLMKQTKSFGYAEGDNYQIVELPYDGNELSMVILLPRLEQFKAIEASLNSQQVNNMIRSIQSRQMILSMPKFRFESNFGLKKTLSAMGMPVAFSTDADFSGMDGKRDLYIKDVIHKSFIYVDEAGTEAAAATGVIMGVTSMPASPIEVTIDHPFIFLIRDVKTGVVLFVGRVLSPSL